MKIINSRIRQLEDRMCRSKAEPRIRVVTNAACKLALDEDRCVQILDECGFLPPGRFGVVHLSGIPDGLNAKELENYLQRNRLAVSGVIRCMGDQETLAGRPRVVAQPKRRLGQIGADEGPRVKIRT